jgi:hypothetical protein
MSAQQDHADPAGQPTTIGFSDITHTNTRRSSKLHRTETQKPRKESRDPNLDINLPYRTLSVDANLEEYTTEKESGVIPIPSKEKGKPEYKLVTFVPNDPENPKNWSKPYKWWCTMVVAFTCFVVAMASSIITADIIDVEKEFGQSEEVVLLSITLFVIGFGVGTYPSFYPNTSTLLTLPRPHGIRATLGNLWPAHCICFYTARRSCIHNSLRRGKEHQHSSRLPSNRRHRILGPNDPCGRHPR